MQVTLDTLRRHQFPAHGAMTVDWEGRLLHIQLRGPFNREMVRDGMRLLARLARQMWPADGRIVELVQWHSSMLMPPEAIADFDRWVAEFAAQGFVPQRTLVVVQPDVEGRWLMLPRLAPSWQGSRPLEVFDDLAQALARAEALLDDLPPLPAPPVKPPG